MSYFVKRAQSRREGKMTEDEMAEQRYHVNERELRSGWKEGETVEERRRKRWRKELLSLVREDDANLTQATKRLHLLQTMDPCFRFSFLSEQMLNPN